MKVCVAGLWHLGSVTAACLAAFGHRVVGLDADPGVIAGLAEGKPPLFEPGLRELLAEGLREARLSFTTEAAPALAGAEAIWITHDTPVDADDNADVEAVLSRVEALFPHLPDGALVLVSSQLIAGCTRRLERLLAARGDLRSIEFAYSPENLRLGKAIEVFTRPDRVVVGARSERGRAIVRQLLAPIEDRLSFMSVESAEMTKHAVNAFLALSVTFANELAAVCEQVGADAKEVEHGLKSERRIGPGAYLSPGAAFAGGTLARDVQYLRALAREHRIPGALMAAVKQSNDEHRAWPQRKLAQCLSPLAGRRIAVLGLTYKPQTDTLRRSASLELCRWLLEQGARVDAHDPRVATTAPELPAQLTLHASALDAMREAEAVVIGTGWLEYQALDPGALVTAMSTKGARTKPLVIDAARFARQLDVAQIDYHAVGTPRSTAGVDA